MGSPRTIAKIQEIYAVNSISGRQGFRNVSPLMFSASKLFDRFSCRRERAEAVDFCVHQGFSLIGPANTIEINGEKIRCVPRRGDFCAEIAWRTT
jgi:hypothetical protein